MNPQCLGNTLRQDHSGIILLQKIPC